MGLLMSVSAACSKKSKVLLPVDSYVDRSFTENCLVMLWDVEAGVTATGAVKDPAAIDPEVGPTLSDVELDTPSGPEIVTVAAAERF